MIAASTKARPRKIFVIAEALHESRSADEFASLFVKGDVLVINDAATLAASLKGLHERTGAAIEVRLAARHSLDARDASSWEAVLFGVGDHRTPTEQRALPPAVLPGDRLLLGPLTARIEALRGHPRMVSLRFEGGAAEIWRGLSSHGRAIQYAHVPAPLHVWDVWTSFAGPPVAVEAPSAGFLLDWSVLAALQARGVEVALLTHAAGLSSTGDSTLDARLPLPEPYSIPASTALAIRRAHLRGSRVVALGTTVARALESAAQGGGVRAGRGVATLRLGSEHRLSVVDVLVTGVHEPETSHYQLMGAFVPAAELDRATAQMEAEGYRHHEFGDAMWIVARALGPDSNVVGAEAST